MSEERREIPDDELISNGMKKNPMKFWIWAAVFLAFILLGWGGSSWIQKNFSIAEAATPFSNVTNREISLMLWDFPHLMRQHAKRKSGYLPGFDYQLRTGIKIGEADELCRAPKELLFLYHTWDRLIKEKSPLRKISRKELIQFLEQSPEWREPFYKDAKKPWLVLANGLKEMTDDQFVAEYASIPYEVQLAFTGWKNYFFDREAINKFVVDGATLKEFLRAYPNYARNYWKNIVEKNYPNYLISAWENKLRSTEQVDESEIPSFVKIAIFNFKAS